MYLYIESQVNKNKHIVIICLKTKKLKCKKKDDNSEYYVLMLDDGKFGKLYTTHTRFKIKNKKHF